MTDYPIELAVIELGKPQQTIIRFRDECSAWQAAVHINKCDSMLAFVRNPKPAFDDTAWINRSFTKWDNK